MSFRKTKHLLMNGLLAVLVVGTLARPLVSVGADLPEITRKVKSKVAPEYPVLARRMNIAGTVRLVVVVSPNGSVKNTKVLGGHPLLVTAAESAVKKWKFETGPEESSGVVEFTFRPEN
ncbi:MAG TPA: energy transducer TonB [Terriglobales bacterium]